MPTATSPTLTEDQIDDLLYLARTGDTADLKIELVQLAKNNSTTPSSIIAATVDPNSGNGLLHMASANGHTDTLNTVLSLTPPNTTTTTPPLLSILNLQNSSGNTPLHWATLNGHLDAVKALIVAGADCSIQNNAGRDVLWEAGLNDKRDVAEWIAMEGKGMDGGLSDGKGEEGCAQVEGGRGVEKGMGGELSDGKEKGSAQVEGEDGGGEGV